MTMVTACGPIARTMPRDGKRGRAKQRIGKARQKTGQAMAKGGEVAHAVYVLVRYFMRTRGYTDMQMADVKRSIFAFFRNGEEMRPFANDVIAKASEMPVAGHSVQHLWFPDEPDNSVKKALVVVNMMVSGNSENMPAKDFAKQVKSAVKQIRRHE